MTTAYNALFELLEKEKREQPKEFNEVIENVNNGQLYSNICELVTQVSRKKIKYSTYSHV